MGTLILTYPAKGDAEGRLEGKFLQLRLDGRDCLLFAASARFRYHNQILARFLSDRGILHRWEGEFRLVLDQADLSVTGGGRFQLDSDRKSLYVWDNSSVYGRFDAAQLAEQLASAGAPWSGLALSVG